MKSLVICEKRLRDLRSIQQTKDEHIKKILKKKRIKRGHWRQDGRGMGQTDREYCRQEKW